MNEKWRIAAKKYDEQDRTKILLAVSEAKVVSATVAAATAVSKPDFLVEGKLLDEYLRSELGRDAMLLLRSSNQHVLFADINEGMSMSIAYFLDGFGFQESLEATGVSWAYRPQEAPAPKCRIIAGSEAIRAANINGAGKTAQELIEHFTKELDRIAEKADKA